MSQGHLTHLALPASREGISVLHSSNWRTHCTICINWILFLWESSNVFLSLCFLLSPLFLHLDRNWISKKNEYVRSLITTGKALQEATDSESTPEGCKLGFFFFILENVLYWFWFIILSQEGVSEPSKRFICLCDPLHPEIFEPQDLGQGLSVYCRKLVRTLDDRQQS